MNLLDGFIQFLGYLVPFIVLIGVLVAVHEWGHYKVARLLGIKASEFAIGMGPVIWSKEDREGCKWQLRALPIGGFVKFWGDGDGSSTSVDAAASEVIDPVERRKMFRHRGPFDRSLVILAGPAINLIMGLAVISGLYMLDGRHVTPPVISELQAGGPAERSGLMVGDRVLTIDGEAVADFSDIAMTVKMHPATDMLFDIDRAGSTLAVSVRTATVSERMLGLEQTVGSIGIVSGPSVLTKLDTFGAIGYGLEDIVTMTRGMFVAVGQIFTGDRSFTELGGPVKIAEMSGNAAKVSFTVYILLMAVISINLGIMNLLPIPVLDGGHIVVCIIEGITRRPVSAKALGLAYTAGGALLLTLMAAITVSDVWGVIDKL